jgi:hypothetical protein
MAKTPEEMIADMVANLKAKTGRSLEEWQPIIKAKGVTKHGEIVSFLKTEHGLTHGFANMIALQALKGPTPEGDPVDAMYAGAKQAVRPIHDALMSKINAFGSDVDVSPKKGYVSLRRSKQFALIQPSTASRVDVGINLKGREPLGRLEASGSFNSMLSHRVRVGSVGEVDDELIGWLRAAYDQA